MLYTAYNGPRPTTTEFTGVTTGTALKTMLQIATPATCPILVVAWGISFRGSAAGTPVTCELLDTDAGATVTAHVSSGVQQHGVASNSVASLMTLGTSATGYTATVEGSITSSRFGDVQYVAPSAGYSYEWPLGREFSVGILRWLRVRVKAAVAVDCITWVRWDE